MKAIPWAAWSLFLIGCALIALSWRFSANAPNTVFSYPAPLRAGEAVTREFQIPSELPYELRIRVTPVAGENPDQLRCVLGIQRVEAQCTGIPLLRLEWKVSAGLKPLYRGSTSLDRAIGLWRSGLERVLVKVRGGQEKPLVLTVKSTVDQQELGRYHPEIRLEPDPSVRRNSHDRFALAYLFGRIALGWGILLLIALKLRWITKV